MSDEQAQEQQRRRGIPAGLDPRNLDPRRALDPATYERMLHAQSVARAQATAATTVVIATMVSLVTSAFGFVAALAWNAAIQEILTENVSNGSLQKKLNLTLGQTELIYAAIVTVIAVIVVVIINRFARGIAKNSVISNGN